MDRTQRVFQTSNDVVVLTASGTGAVEASVINLVKKGDNIVIPVNGNLGEDWLTSLIIGGGNSIRIIQNLERIHLLNKLRTHLRQTRT